MQKVAGQTTVNSGLSAGKINEAAHKPRKKVDTHRRLDRAIRPTLERLELRQMLSASLPTGSLDPTFNTLPVFFLRAKCVGGARLTEI